MTFSHETFFTITVPRNKSYVPIKIWNFDELISLFSTNGFDLVNQNIRNELSSFGHDEKNILTPDLLFRNNFFYDYKLATLPVGILHLPFFCR